MSSGVLRFEGSTHFRQRLVCSTLSGRPIRIDNIRAQDQNPGLRDFEACLLRLFEKITDGCVVEINETGALPCAAVMAPDILLHGKHTVGHQQCSGNIPVIAIGTSLRYRPGIVTGGNGLVHECGIARGIGYFLEPLICVALFGRKVRGRPVS
jgi:RNA 3'-terminal phosphate cyclase-like protein